MVQTPPCAAPRTNRPLGRIVRAPMRPLSAVRAPVVRWTCPMGLGPRGAQVELNVLVPTGNVLALPAAFDRLAAADSTLGGVSPAVMSSMEAQSPAARRAASSPELAGNGVSGELCLVSPLGGRTGVAGPRTGGR